MKIGIYLGGAVGKVFAGPAAGLAEMEDLSTEKERVRPAAQCQAAARRER